MDQIAMDAAMAGWIGPHITKKVLAGEYVLSQSEEVRDTLKKLTSDDIKDSILCHPK
jgi:hypothetical protein